MIKYLLICEDEKLWAAFKKIKSKNINEEIMDLIREKVQRAKTK